MLLFSNGSYIEESYVLLQNVKS